MRGGRVGRAAAVVVLPVVIVVALVPVRSDVRNANLALGLVLVVLAAAVIGGRRVGVVVGVVVAVAFDFFLTEPYGSFTIDRSGDVQTTILLGAVGVVGGELVERARRSQSEADARTQELERFRRRAELAAWGERPGRLIGRAGEELAEMLELLDVAYESGPPPADMSILTHLGTRVPGVPSVVDGNVAAIPVRAHGRILGHFVLTFPVDAPATVASDVRHDAIAVADQLAMALLRHQHD